MRDKSSTIYPLPQVLISSEAIETRWRELAQEIDAKAKGTKLHVIVVMKGAFFFAANLVKHLQSPLELHFLQASSYAGGTQSTGHLEIITPWPQIPKQALILLLDDILDTGLTLSRLQKKIQEKYQPHTLWTSVFLKKEIPRVFEPEINFIGFPIPDAFVVGCGLDYQELYRNLPYVGFFEVSPAANLSESLEGKRFSP